MTTPDMLELAQETLRDISGRAGPDEISAQAQFASAAALVAIATGLRNLNAILHDATDLSGAVKVALPHPVEQALIAIAEQRQPQAPDPTAATAYNDDHS